MKKIGIIVLVFLLAFLTSALFEIDFISKNMVRCVLVIMLIIMEFVTGFFVLKNMNIEEK